MNARLALILAATSIATLGLTRPMVAAPRKEPEPEPEMPAADAPAPVVNRQQRRAAERASVKALKRMKRRVRV